MNYIHNPFVLFGYDGPEYFCDRQIETEQLTSSLRNGRNITLTAPRRMGKTTLIKHVFNRIGSKGSGVYCFYMDIFATHSLADFVSLFGRTVIGRLDSSPEKALGMAAGTIRSARLVFSADMMGQSQVSLEFLPQYAEEVLGEIFEYMRRSGKECYVAIDDFSSWWNMQKQEWRPCCVPMWSSAPMSGLSSLAASRTSWTIYSATPAGRSIAVRRRCASV